MPAFAILTFRYANLLLVPKGPLALAKTATGFALKLACTASSRKCRKMNLSLIARWKMLPV